MHEKRVRPSQRKISMHPISNSSLRIKSLNVDTHTQKPMMTMTTMKMSNHKQKYVILKMQKSESDIDDSNCLKSLFGDLFGK